jgi:hypothetical protein
VSTGPRIKTLDIETSPIVAYVWSLWKVNIGLNQIVKEWSILSYCVKDLGSKRVRYEDTSSKEDPRDDSDLLIALHAELSDCDIVIAQNGKAFDLKKINARFIEAGLPPVPPIKVIDTMLIAKDVAKFTSNKLEWLSKHLTDTPKYAHSEFPGMELWTECLKGNKKAWKAMRKYNCIDVPATEELYLKLRPYMIGHPNVAAYYDDDKTRCPRCASTKLTPMEKPALTQSGEYTRYQCGECGGFARSRYTQNTKAKRLSLLAN